MGAIGQGRSRRLNTNYAEIKESYFKIPGSNVPKYLNLKLSNFLKFLFFFIVAFPIKSGLVRKKDRNETILYKNHLLQSRF